MTTTNKAVSFEQDPRLHHAVFDLVRENDRGMAIVGAALIDSSLADCIKQRLRKPATDKDTMTRDAIKQMFDPDWPLGSFSARYKLAYLMGVIGPETFADIKIINDIRREFAHYASAVENTRLLILRFTHQKISSKIRNLKIASRVHGKYMNLNFPNEPDKTELATMFLNSVIGIATPLWIDAISVLETGKGRPEMLP